MDFTGLYKVTFGTPLGAGYGVAYLREGKLNGGDSMMAYVGTYSIDGTVFTANVHAYQHSTIPGMTSTLGTNNAHLDITGSVQGATMTGQGTSAQAPGMTLQVHLERLNDGEH